ncbi:hypothetical protein ACFQS7_16345 [Dankookia sp. GCM10030260]|uniref:hypothetical protein n=1 Tax=Dankookia sp. GCM10030260 TaxID=3273390 RepID=UPI003621017D
MSKAPLPPVSPAGISPKGPGPHQDHAGDHQAATAEAGKAAQDRILAEQDATRQGQKPDR